MRRIYRKNFIKKTSKRRSGITLPMALMLFMICAAAALAITSCRISSVYRSSLIRRFEREYASASSAAILIRDSLAYPMSVNVITGACLQCADGGETLTMTVQADGLPDSVCTVYFDNELNMNAEVTSGSLKLILKIAPEIPGIPVWNRKDALIERVY